ncbi:hypothetical protein OESDEN_00793 [Oesophagostomum dentatum]|uniref:Uncharacterized protein n=1 Tax=Oesophagostomum dentatum TaxID=61180 RepID=A0A0B1TPR0_OESDE|nr:hypothetical protein OESDEN_00793 [Oesophagostomum dentatum]
MKKIVGKGHKSGRRITWWWRLDSNDIGFCVYRAAPGQEKVPEHADDFMVHPKFRLQTEYVPEDGEVRKGEDVLEFMIYNSRPSKQSSKKDGTIPILQSLDNRKR